MDDQTTLAILALVGIGGAAYMMGGRTTDKKKREAARIVYDTLVEEGMAPEQARNVVDVTPIRTPYDVQFFGAVLKNSADQYLALNKTDYVDYNAWQNVRVEELTNQEVDSLFRQSISDLQDMTDEGPFGSMNTRLRAVPNDTAVYVQPAGYMGGFLALKEEWVLFLQTVNVVMTNNAIATSNEQDLVRGLKDYVNSFFSAKASVSFEDATEIIESLAQTFTARGSSIPANPQAWVVEDFDGLGSIPMFSVVTDEFVNAARDKYLKNAEITVEEVDKLVDIYIDLVVSMEQNMPVTDAHLYYDAATREVIRHTLFAAGDKLPEGSPPMPSSLEELRDSLISQGYTFDQIELLNRVLRDANTAERAIELLSDPVTISELGGIHGEVIKLIASLKLAATG